jgi:SAM-dependent methyltransferase
MSIDPATYEFYQREAPFYSLDPAIGPSRHLDPFLDRLKPGARVLEIGCGTGRDSARIAERGFDLDATDGVPAMVAKTNQRYDLGARLMRFDELDADAHYDAVWAHACLLHCPTAELPSVLARIRRALKPGGLHYASYKLGTGEGRDLLGRLHNFPTATWLIAAYRDAGFAIDDQIMFAGKGSDGTMRDWFALTARRGS